MLQMASSESASPLFWICSHTGMNAFFQAWFTCLLLYQDVNLAHCVIGRVLFVVVVSVDLPSARMYMLARHSSGLSGTTYPAASGLRSFSSFQRVDCAHAGAVVQRMDEWPCGACTSAPCFILESSHCS